MNYIYEVKRKTPIIAETDVLVVGGGPAGLSAAISASREGMKTILIERYGSLGGNITHAMVESIAWYRHEKTIEAGGLNFEFEEKAKAIGATMEDPESIGVLLDTELFKVVADNILLESGATPLLHTFAVDVIMDGQVIKGVITESKSGRGAILAKRVIDATGDADVAFRAGAPYKIAPVNQRMAVTVNFAIRGVNIDEFLDHMKSKPGKISDWATETSGKEDNLYSPYIVEPFLKAKEAGEIPDYARIESYWSGGYSESGDVTNLNAVHIYNIDSTNVWDLTKAEIEGRKQAILAIKALKKYMPGFKNAKLRNFGCSIGTRESRKIVGAYELTGYDVKNEARFDDSIGACPEFLDAYGIVIIPTTGRYFHVPYRATIPKKIDNLLVAGRSIASDRVAFAATRQMVCCTITGQAVGVAAAISIKDKVNCKEVNINKVQEALKRQGVRVF